MKYSHVTIILIVLLAGVVLFQYNKNPVIEPNTTQTTQTAEGNVVVVLTPDGYVPNDFTIPLGATVTFTAKTGRPHWPASNLHPTHDIYPEFDPRRPLEPNESWSFTFTEPGQWNFHDHIRAYYTGTVYVEE